MTIRKRFLAFAVGFFALCMLVASCAQPSGSGTASGGGSSGGGGEDIDPALYELLAGIYEGDEFDYIFEIDETGMGGTGFVIDHGTFFSIRAADSELSSGEFFTWKVLRVRGDEVHVEITVDGERLVRGFFNIKDGTLLIHGKRYKVRDDIPELEAAPSVGSIIMKDGSLKTSDSISGADKPNAIAVVYKVDAANKQAWAVGKVQNKRGVQWCVSNASGSRKHILNLTTSTNAGTFSGYTDGRTGLASLKAAVDDYDRTYYPAWYWCMVYGTEQAGLTEYDTLAKGWYFPTVKELNDIYQVKSAVEKALEASGGSKFSSADYWSGADYWSSSLYDHNSAFTFNFDNGSYPTLDRDQQRYVCAVRVFAY